MAADEGAADMLGRKGWAAFSTATLAASALVLYFQASQRQSDEKPGPEFASVGEPAPAQTSDPEVIVAGQEASPSEPAPEHISGAKRDRASTERGSIDRPDRTPGARYRVG